MRLGKGRQFAIILELCGLAAVGATSAICCGSHGVLKAALPVDAGCVSRCAGNNTAFSGFNASPARGADHIRAWTEIAKSPLVDRSPRSPHRRQFPHASYGMDEVVAPERANEYFTHLRHFALSQHHDDWIAKKAWAAVPANHIPCCDRTRMYPLAGLRVDGTSLPYSILARGPPRPG